MKITDIACIHFAKESKNGAPDATSNVIGQFNYAAERLKGTGIDLVVTCEGMESVGQTMEQAESPESPGPLYNLYKNFAMENRCTIAGSIKLEEKGKIYNALVYIGPDGSFLGDYKKTFLTNGEVELGIAPGEGATVINTPAGNLGGVICFDLQYDALRDQYKKMNPDILVFSSMYHGGHIRRNWAHKCHSFFAAACKDNKSGIISPLGKDLASANYYTRIARHKVNLDKFVMHQDRNIDILPDVLRKYGKQITLEQQEDLGTVVLYSDSNNITASEIASEFGLVQMDKYLQESAQTLVGLRNK
jgi:predicted amidohydrolase